MPDGVGEVQDFMPLPRTGEATHRHRMIRRVLAVRGQMRFVVDVAPATTRVSASWVPASVVTIFATGSIAVTVSRRNRTLGCVTEE